jgi:hypothetical protein
MQNVEVSSSFHIYESYYSWLEVQKGGQSRALCAFYNGILYCIFFLKCLCHEIFGPQFFRKSITPKPQIDTLKYFIILFRILRDICLESLILRYAA